MRKVCEEREEGKLFYENVMWKVGIGKIINFWEDRWIGESPLSINISRLFTNSKEATIDEIGIWTYSCGLEMKEWMI